MYTHRQISFLLKNKSPESPPHKYDFDHLCLIPDNLKGLYYVYGQGSDKREVVRKFFIPLNHIVYVYYYIKKRGDPSIHKIMIYQEYLNLSEEEKKEISSVKVTADKKFWNINHIFEDPNYDFGYVVLYEDKYNVGAVTRPGANPNYVYQIRKDGNIYLYWDGVKENLFTKYLLLINK